jgi:protein-tyrosine phosphatase
MGAQRTNSGCRAGEFEPIAPARKVSPARRRAFTSGQLARKLVGVSCEHVVALQQPAQHWDFEGCCNFRDLGGYRAPGGVIRGRRLFRSDSLTSASVSDRARLAQLQLATVIDLRSQAEVSLVGRFYRGSVAYHNLPLGDPIAEATSVGWDDPELVALHYFELLQSSSDSIAEALAILTDPASYPTVIHCSVGKDRTGILVAVLLSAIGVDDDDVVADYALSGMGAARLALRLRELCAANPADLERFLPALLSADPDTMRCFLALLREEFGSASGYVAHLGLGSAIGFLSAAMVEPTV